MVSDQTLLRIIPSQKFVGLFGDLVRSVILAAIVIAIVAAVAYHAASLRFMASLQFNDFGRFYYAAELASAGKDMYASTPATDVRFGPRDVRPFHNLNPPHFHLLVAPLTRLGVERAFSIWAVLSVLALTASAGRIATELRWKWSPKRLLLVTLAILASSPTAATVVTGQLSFLLMFPLTLAWAEARAGRWTRAAVIIGCLVSIKPFLGMFVLYFAFRKQWDSLRLACLTGLSLALLGALVYGPESYLSWVKAVTAVDWSWAVMNGSLEGILDRAFGSSPYFHPVAEVPFLAGQFVTVAAGVLCIATTALVARTALGADYVFASLLMTALFLTPLGWVYYLPLAAGPLLAVLQKSLRHSPSARNLAIMAIPGLICPIQLAGNAPSGAITSLTIGSIYGWTTLALWAATLILGINGLRHPPHLTAMVSPYSRGDWAP